MEIERRIDAQEKTLARQLEWIRHADTKVQIVVAANLALIAALLAVCPPNEKTDWRVAVCLIIGLACPATSLYDCYHAVAPRLGKLKETNLIHLGTLKLVHTKAEKFGEPTPDKSLLFFLGITKHTEAEHRVEVERRTLDEYLIDLNDQVHVNARIAASKYTWVAEAMRIMFIGVIPWFIAIYALRRF